MRFFADEDCCFVQDYQKYDLFNLPENFVIKGSVDLSFMGLSKLPNLSKVIVEGDFFCSSSKLTSLKGAPREVGGNFDCSRSNLTSLEGAPQKVGGDFSFEHNNLTSLKGAPREVGGNFDCSRSNLTSLEGAPQKVGGYFGCRDNELTSLEGAPREVGGNFDCAHNKFTSLKGAPREVGGDFCCYSDELTSLEGAPREVGGNFDCRFSNLTSLEGAPKEVGGIFDGLYNPLDSFEGAPVMCNGSRFQCDLVILKFDEYFDGNYKGKYFPADEKKEQLVKANAKKVYETLKTRERIEAFFKSADEKLKDPDDKKVLKCACESAYWYSDYVLLRKVFSSTSRPERKTETKSDDEQNLALMFKLREGMTR